MELIEASLVDFLSYSEDEIEVIRILPVNFQLKFDSEIRLRGPRSLKYDREFYGAERLVPRDCQSRVKVSVLLPSVVKQALTLAQARMKDK